jgi:NAD(P)-dependent dehydrogenase (short-subunit alcohol dehydrogenase family)
MSWTPEALGDLAGKTYVITGGNSGLGLEAAKILAAHGGTVRITARDAAKAEDALAQVRAVAPAADVGFFPLDLADPESTLAAADLIREQCPKIAALINNAGVMQPPERRTVEGFELQIGTNHLGHFRLTSRLYPHLRANAARIVTVSSVAHRFGRIQLDDLQFRKGYDATRAYGQSKLANLMFGLELHRRLRAAGSPAVSIACHPGYAATNLQSAGVGMDGGSALFRAIYAVSNRLMAQSAEAGAYPLVLAAAADDAEAGAYYGPTWLGDTRGPVGKSTVAPHAQDQEVARKLWEASEALVGPFVVN